MGGIGSILTKIQNYYTNPRPNRVLEIGQRLKVKVTDVKEDRLIVSQKAFFLIHGIIWIIKKAQ